MKQDIFAVKLCELARQFERMQRRLRLCQTEDHPRIRQEMTRLLKEYRETDQLLSRRAAASRSSAAAALSAAQQAYCREAEKILEQAAPHAQPGGETAAEAMALYAEYAMDFAAQAMRHTLLAALTAIDLQMTCEERNDTHERDQTP